MAKIDANAIICYDFQTTTSILTTMMKYNETIK